MINSLKNLLYSNFIGKVLGFLREILLAYIFGTGSIIDFFRLCNSLVLTPLNLFVGNSLQQVFIPNYKKKDNKIQFVLSISIMILILSIILCLILFIFAGEIIESFLGAEYSDGEVHIATNFLKIFTLGIPFYVLNWMIIYTLNSNKNFKENGRNILNFNLVLIGVTAIFLLFPNVYLIPASFVLANIFIVIQLCYKYSKKIKRALRSLKKLTFALVFSENRSFLSLWMPLLVYSLFMQIYILVERWLLSKEKGLIAASEYAKVIIDTPIFLLTLPLATIGLTYFNRNERSITNKIVSMLFFVTLISISLTSMLYMNQESIIRMLYYRGNFDEESLTLVLSILKFYIIGFAFFSVNTFLYRIYNAELRNKELSLVIISAHIIAFIFMIVCYQLGYKVNIIVGYSFIILNAIQFFILICRIRLNIRSVVRSAFFKKLLLINIVYVLIGFLIYNLNENQYIHYLLIMLWITVFLYSAYILKKEVD
ncbi:lipid II flippase MurJ [Terribacillus saccharophilus]|uniref:Murein biosynthesis integral membrane protein MurJ n=1 Tax=Terribacillus saccharophilus TaxID=361277 RepID=A0A268AEU8_9BACI|nr:lipid II flippase MurJ [Terribacillus saccharophilus]PAD22647.1 hypothetical protein CHH64_02730 [Terribacillus saccharophilus]